MIDRQFWIDRRVFVTGHTGFKGAWICLMLRALGAKVFGYALAPEVENGTYQLCNIRSEIVEHVADMRDLAALRAALAAANPSVVLHMAAQSLVRRSYGDPIGTYSTNVMGTVNLLEAIRSTPGIAAVIIITSDKCYENREWPWGYRETDRLGGHDPYSNSKACAELVTDAFRRSYFQSADAAHIASARAGNVIGGGDWSVDRLVPDAIRAFMAGRPVVVRNPLSVRPWQHVLDPLLGYLLLAQRLCTDGLKCAESWNFGPGLSSEVRVRDVMDAAAHAWGGHARWQQDSVQHLHESTSLRLDSAKSRATLGWRPLIDLNQAITWTIDWYKAFQRGSDVRSITLAQIMVALEVSSQYQASSYD